MGLQSPDAFTRIPDIYVHPEVYDKYFTSSEWTRVLSSIYPLPEELMEPMALSDEESDGGEE